MGRFDRFGRSSFASIVAVGLVVLGLITAGVSTLMKGRLHYGNYWGGSVFAPFALLIAAIIVVGVVVSRIRGEKPAKKLRGRAARKARQAENTKFPIDDYKSGDAHFRSGEEVELISARQRMSRALTPTLPEEI